MSRVVT